VIENLRDDEAWNAGTDHQARRSAPQIMAAELDA
jgi:hypothetical protein